jgi:hypothetical protein
VEGPLSGTENASRESKMGQNKKSSQRAYVFRIDPDSCRKRAVPALTFSAISGLPVPIDGAVKSADPVVRFERPLRVV